MFNRTGPGAARILMSRPNPIVSLVIMAGLLLLLAPLPVVHSHEVPTAVVVQTIVKASGDELDLLVRVPLEAALAT